MYKRQEVPGELVCRGANVMLGYYKNPGHFGATIGRNGNRIKNAAFSINGKEYPLAVNDNCLLYTSMVRWSEGEEPETTEDITLQKMHLQKIFISLCGREDVYKRQLPSYAIPRNKCYYIRFL